MAGLVQGQVVKAILLARREDGDRSVEVCELTPDRRLKVDAIASTASAAYATPTHTAVNVTVASGLVLAANADRRYALLINDSDTPIYLALGVAAAVNQGIRLNAAGGSYEMSAPLGNLYTGAVYAIHGGAGNKVLLVTEGV